MTPDDPHTQHRVTARFAGEVKVVILRPETLLFFTSFMLKDSGKLLNRTNVIFTAVMWATDETIERQCYIVRANNSATYCTAHIHDGPTHLVCFC